MRPSFFSLLACFTFLFSWAQEPQIVVPFRSGNKWGYSDTLAKIKIKPKYDTVSLFDYDMVYKDNHVIAEVKLNGKPMMINEKGSVVIPPKYDYIKLIYGLQEPTFIISKNNKFGLFAKGKELFAPVSDWLADPYPGLYEVRVNGRSGLINSKGEIVIPLIYDRLRLIGGKKSGIVEWQCILYGNGPEVRTVKLLEDNWLSQRIPDVETLSRFMTSDDLNKALDSAKEQYGIDSIKLMNNTGIVYKATRTGIFLSGEAKTVYLFSKPYTIHQIKYFSAHSRNSWNKNSAAYIIASIKGKYGIINEREEQVLPFEYDGIEEKDGFFLLKQNSRIGFFIWNSVYPVVQPAYEEYIGKQHIPVNNGWRFTLFRIMKNGRGGFVGENGVAYFKD